MALTEITNYIKISHRIASSGQPEHDQFIDIANAGYQSIINLAMSDSENSITKEPQIVESLNMSYSHIPVPFDKPEIAHLKEFFNVMAKLTDQKIWIHCVVNYRVSAFLYLYQKLDNKLPHDVAKKAILTSWQPNPIWTNL